MVYEVDVEYWSEGEKRSFCESFSRKSDATRFANKARRDPRTATVQVWSNSGSVEAHFKATK